MVYKKSWPRCNCWKQFRGMLHQTLHSSASNKHHVSSPSCSFHLVYTEVKLKFLACIWMHSIAGIYNINEPSQMLLESCPPGERGSPTAGDGASPGTHEKSQSNLPQKSQPSHPTCLHGLQGTFHHLSEWNKNKVVIYAIYQRKTTWYSQTSGTERSTSWAQLTVITHPAQEGLVVHPLQQGATAHTDYNATLQFAHAVTFPDFFPKTIFLHSHYFNLILN